MSTCGRVLLADDSPHAQRMGERILRAEGFEVLTVADGETAILRVRDFNPDVVVADAFLPLVSGYDLCGYIKKQPQHVHVRVLLTSTALERVDDDQAFHVGADGQLKKPFEASVMLKSLKDLISGSDKDAKKKRSGSTFDLSSPVTTDHDSPADDIGSRESARPSESGVSPLQAWLEQHGNDTDDLNGGADLDPLKLKEEPAPVRRVEAVRVVEPQDSSEPARAAKSGILREPSAMREESPVAESRTFSEPVSLSNPQLLRRPEDEPEDLSLRNNPVARLRNMPPSPAAPTRVHSIDNRVADSDSGKPSVVAGSRSSLASFLADETKPVDETVPRPPDAPRQRRSLLDALAEFESASESFDEPDSPHGEVISPTAVQSREIQSLEIDSVPVASQSDAALVEETTDSASVADEAGYASAASVVDLSDIEGDVEEEDTVAEPPAALSDDATKSIPEAALGAIDAAVGGAVADVVSKISLADSGVRLDEEELRAAVEIAVSAAMPSIVEEVTRCVSLTLNARYQELQERQQDRASK